jgi:hypothetical protein
MSTLGLFLEQRQSFLQTAVHSIERLRDDGDLIVSLRCNRLYADFSTADPVGCRRDDAQRPDDKPENCRIKRGDRE